MASEASLVELCLEENHELTVDRFFAFIADAKSFFAALLTELFAVELHVAADEVYVFVNSLYRSHRISRKSSGVN